MRKDLELWQFTALKLKEKQSVTLFVVAETDGSSRGRHGFKMIVVGGEMRERIGGDVMEVALVEKAKSQSVRQVH